MVEYQYRTKQGEGWGSWNNLSGVDFTTPSVYGNLNAESWTGITAFEIRLKPEFLPGWFRATSYKYGHRDTLRLVDWFESQEAIDTSAWTWERVRVTPMEEGE